MSLNLFTDAEEHNHDGVNSQQIYFSNVNNDKVFGGKISDQGTALTDFPGGWSVSRTGTGTYDVVHNLNSTAFIVNTTSSGALRLTGGITYVNLNTFRYFTTDTSGNLLDSVSQFIMLKL